MDDEIPPSAKNAAQVAIVSSIFIGILLVSSVIWYLTRAKITTPNTVNISPVPSQPQATQALSPTSTITYVPSSQIETYTSPRLGIEFHYNPKVEQDMGGELTAIKVQETGNKIFVYPSSLPPEQGQFIEVFDKNAGTSLEATIRSTFLAGKDPKRCLITTRQDRAYTIAEITFPPNPSGSVDAYFADSVYCSEAYAQTNGLRYFMEDSAHPDRFFFVSIGQYAIYAEKGIPWQQTIQILN